MKYTERYNARGLEKLKEYEAANGIYHVGDLWRFRKEDNALIAMFNYEEKDLETTGPLGSCREEREHSVDTARTAPGGGIQSPRAAALTRTSRWVFI